MRLVLSSGDSVFFSRKDYPLIRKFKWRRLQVGHLKYAITHVKKNGKWTTVCMHRLILGIKDRRKVDHMDGDGLNNRRRNLRRSGRSGNNHNRKKIARVHHTSKYKGVSKNGDWWRAGIRFNDKHIHLGTFAKEKTAALAYDSAARDLFGKFACVNFPKVGERGAI